MSAEHAAREAIARCASQPGKALVSLGKCQRSYFKCGADNTLLMCVRSSDVFSEAFGGCAPRSRVAECRNAAAVRAKQISASNAPSSQAKNATAAANETPAAAKTCGERADGFYQHRENCARIIQVKFCIFRAENSSNDTFSASTANSTNIRLVQKASSSTKRAKNATIFKMSPAAPRLPPPRESRARCLLQL